MTHYESRLLELGGRPTGRRVLASRRNQQARAERMRYAQSFRWFRGESYNAARRLERMLNEL